MASEHWMMLLFQTLFLTLKYFLLPEALYISLNWLLMTFCHKAFLKTGSEYNPWTDQSSNNHFSKETSFLHSTFSPWNVVILEWFQCLNPENPWVEGEMNQFLPYCYQQQKRLYSFLPECSLSSLFLHLYELFHHLFAKPLQSGFSFLPVFPLWGVQNH